MDGLITLRMICKARSCAKLTGMIDADHVPISHVSGSLQLDDFFHENITSTIARTCVCRGCRGACEIFDVRRDS